ncbi:MAG: hypothetical protein ACR2LQ_12390 [Acidimicrobiales bacterium]
MSAFVICLIVLAAAMVVISRSIDEGQPATEEAPAAREDPTRRGPRHLAADAPQSVEPSFRAAAVLDVPISSGRRIRSAALLAVLLTSLGVAAAIGVGVLAVALLTALRTAIGS